MLVERIIVRRFEGAIELHRTAWIRYKDQFFVREVACLPDSVDQRILRHNRLQVVEQRMVWKDQHSRDVIPEGDGVGLRVVIETWVREDGSSYRTRKSVFVAKEGLIDVIRCISKVVKPDEIEEIIGAFPTYLIFCLDSGFTDNIENYRIPCAKKLNSAEDRCGIKYCGDGFANE